MSDFKVKLLAKKNGDKKIFELTPMIDAIDEHGKAIKVEGRKERFTREELQRQINLTELRLARFKAVEAEVIEVNTINTNKQDSIQEV